MKKEKLFKIILTAVLVALNVILERFVPAYQLWYINLNFGFVTVAFAACYLGPQYAVLVGGLGDLIGALIRPFGPYFVGYTITNMLVGLCFGLLLYKKVTVLKISLAVLINTITCSLLLNTLFIYFFSTKGYWAILLGRAPSIIVTAVIQIIIISILFTEKSKINHLIKKAFPKF